MGIFDFFKKKARPKEPSPEQTIFVDSALEIVTPSVLKFGFQFHRKKIEGYFSTIIYRKENMYIKISSSTYPTDYPSHYNLILGDGDSDEFFESDWNSIPLWRLKNLIKKNSDASEYEFPYVDAVKLNLEHANSELLKYAITFLNGDLNLFREALKEQSEIREPYKSHSKDSNGKYKTTARSAKSPDLAG